MPHVFHDPENKNQTRSPDKVAETNAESTQATDEMFVVDEAHDNEESSLSDEIRAAIRTEYREDRAALKEGEQRHADSFDKLALAILTGALGLSVAFVKDIAPKPDPGTVWMILLGWGVLTVGLLASLIGIYLAQLSYKVLPIESIDDGGPSARFKPIWTPDAHVGSVKGMSGGPVFVQYEGTVYWCGVQSAEVIAGDEVRELIVCPSWFVVLILTRLASATKQIATDARHLFFNGRSE